MTLDSMPSDPSNEAITPPLPSGHSLEGSAWMLPSVGVRFLLSWTVASTRGWFGKLSQSFGRLGHYSLVTGVIAATLLVILGSWYQFGSPLMKLILILVIPIAGALGQFAGETFIGMSDRLVANTRTRASSLILFQFFGMLLILAAFVMLMIGISMAFSDRDASAYELLSAFPLVALFLMTSIALFAQGLLFIDPTSSLNLQIDGACSAGEDGIGIIGTLMKAYLACARVIFGTLCLIGGLASITGLVIVLFSRGGSMFGSGVAASGLVCLGIGAFAPLVIYLLSAIYYILIDVVTGLAHAGSRIRD